MAAEDRRNRKGDLRKGTDRHPAPAEHDRIPGTRISVEGEPRDGNPVCVGTRRCERGIPHSLYAGSIFQDKNIPDAEKRHHKMATWT